MIYKFSQEAYWQRPDRGPLITPTFPKRSTGSGKEKTFPNEFVDYLEKINTEDGFKHLSSPTFGPSRGLILKYKNKKLVSRKIIYVLAVYPGEDNYVEVTKTWNKWGLIKGLPIDKIPPSSITRQNSPTLVHEVYGTYGDKLSFTVLCPIMGDRYIEMKWLEKA